MAVMDIRLTSAVFQVFAADLDRSIGFYRLLGLSVPDPEMPHVAVELPGGNRLSLDTEETIAGNASGMDAAVVPGQQTGACARRRISCGG